MTRPGEARLRRASPSEQRAKRAEVDDPEQVLAAALRFIEVRQRSVAEVRQRLTRAGYRQELIAAALVRLADLGILDDEAFTAAWVESRDRARPRGERALRRELALKGVDRSVIDAAMRERRPQPGVAGDPDQQAAEQLLARHATALARIPDVRRRRERAYALLARNGFDVDTSARLAARVSEPPAAEPRSTDL
ncbi:MAG TPA: regulatory protein RecX [Candidatus Limnocylindrales bacterium]|nr:regulatory protein RecX [Candidatus Limnocylindrales bacterium]